MLYVVLATELVAHAEKSDDVFMQVAGAQIYRAQRYVLSGDVADYLDGLGWKNAIGSKEWANEALSAVNLPNQPIFIEAFYDFGQQETYGVLVVPVFDGVALMPFRWSDHFKQPMPLMGELLLSREFGLQLRARYTVEDEPGSQWPDNMEWYTNQFGFNITDWTMSFLAYLTMPHSPIKVGPEVLFPRENNLRAMAGQPPLLSYRVVSWKPTSAKAKLCAEQALDTASAL